MTIDPKTLPLDARVEATADHFPDDFTHFTTAKDVRDRGDLSIVRAFVPVPDGVAYDDALRAVNDARPWVEWDGRRDLPEGTRVRKEWRIRQGFPAPTLVHPDDVPDPGADLIERMAKAMKASDADAHARRELGTYGTLARAALAVIREDGAR